MPGPVAIGLALALLFLFHSRKTHLPYSPSSYWRSFAHATAHPGHGSVLAAVSDAPFSRMTPRTTTP